jgi:hypothetical protein
MPHADWLVLLSIEVTFATKPPCAALAAASAVTATIENIDYLNADQAIN